MISDEELQRYKNMANHDEHFSVSYAERLLSEITALRKIAEDAQVIIDEGPCLYGDLRKSMKQWREGKDVNDV